MLASLSKIRTTQFRHTGKHMYSYECFKVEHFQQVIQKFEYLQLENITIG